MKKRPKFPCNLWISFVANACIVHPCTCCTWLSRNIRENRDRYSVITVTDFTMICLVNWIELDVNDLNVCVLRYLLMKCTIKFTFWIANTWRNIKTTAYREIFAPLPPPLFVGKFNSDQWVDFSLQCFFNNWRKFTMKLFEGV